MKVLKAGDVAVILIILLITAGALGVRFFSAEEPAFVTLVSEGGTEVYSLKEDRTVTVESNGITLCLVIEDESARITSSDCPSKVCVNTGGITKAGEMIACIPARVLVKITGEEKNDYDQLLG